MITQPSTPSSSLIPATPPKSKKTLLLAISTLVLVAVLAAAAFLAGRLMDRKPDRPQLQILGGPQGDGSLAFRAGSESAAAAVTGDLSSAIDFQPAEELPTTPPVTSGVFTRREDNRLFLGTGNMSLSMVSGPEGGDAPEPSTSYDGPEVEVVITKETLIYRDVTSPDFENPSAVIKQELEDGSLDDFTSQSTITVWGQKTGDRIVAEVILYSQPMMIKMPAP
jgi:hypothetical protein